MENNERVYTEATPRLVALHKDYGGIKSGDADRAVFFDNLDTDGNSGNFSALSAWYTPFPMMRKLTEQEFIDFMDLGELDKQVNGMNDAVNKPSHYTSGKVECIDSIESSMSKEAFQGFLKGQVAKYIWRYEKKENPLQDLKKAQFYINKLIEGYDQT
jgi:hypothetical protein